ncbi:MAG: hypothetical protein QGH73_08505 [Rhodospirillales bacterium]|jgi:hypothetical protein|nr:hypothetical protein [Rhodospirillales bacterium]MDP6642651.1 hypothetical protein [Rhodospirillales bacterium]MDP6841706.1 hypothetical protein [Rhodospirillales bacterium]|tara:strand:- start:909 stop:1181 length:273 start_codon:yes stop_codon:yes gene_type:complete
MRLGLQAWLLGLSMLAAVALTPVTLLAQAGLRTIGPALTKQSTSRGIEAVRKGMQRKSDHEAEAGPEKNPKAAVKGGPKSDPKSAPERNK